MRDCIRIMQFDGHEQHLSRFLKDEQTAGQFFKLMSKTAVFRKYAAKTLYVLPSEWIRRNDFLRSLGSPKIKLNSIKTDGKTLTILFNSRYVTTFDERPIIKIVDSCDADILSIRVCPHLKNQKELVRLTPDNKVAGFRRLYDNAVEPSPLKELPHVILLRNCMPEFFTSGKWVSSSVAELKAHVQKTGLSLLNLQVGGELLDLQSHDKSTLLEEINLISKNMHPPADTYRVRPFFSYACLFKRTLDIAASACILLAIFPLLLCIALLVKINSPGPIFYPAKRQGLHGKPFNCLKFRTMIMQADSMQDRLRSVNQVDGPQFKIENDPRISGVGKFLRDTCIDELPQFLNVLLGQMSVVGPRPSPASENESCPWWRDARLSVRPGITGLWQVCRTRRNSMDFQEWVYFDTKYVRNLSLYLDTVICFKTAKKLICNFLDQFG